MSKKETKDIKKARRKIKFWRGQVNFTESNYLKKLRKHKKLMTELHKTVDDYNRYKAFLADNISQLVKLLNKTYPTERQEK